MRSPRKVGEILLQAGVIDELQLKSALAERQNWGRRIGVTLIKLGMVQEEHLLRALSQQLGLPATRLADRRIAPEVIALVPARVAMDHAVIPLFVERTGKHGVLFLGLGDFEPELSLEEVAPAPEVEIPIMPTVPPPGPRAQPAPRREMAQKAFTTPTQTPPATPTTELPTASAPKAEPPTQVVTTAPAVPPELKIPEGLAEDIQRAIEETERTRVVVKALTQLMVERHLLSVAEIQGQVTKLIESRPET